MTFHDELNEIRRRAGVPLKETQNDLSDVAEWLNTTPDKLKIRIVQEPIQKFLEQIEQMEATYDEFPKDARRTKKIFNLLKKGESPQPIYVTDGDPHLFVMEGRHRMVAFKWMGMKTIPVAYASVAQ